MTLVSPEELFETYPCIFHMAEDGSWESISRHGLLSTSALLDLFEVSGAARNSIESQHRPQSTTVSHEAHGTCVIRDQKPMSIGALQKCLADGLSPADWFRILNGRVFFWATRDRLLRLLKGRMYRDLFHDVLTIDCRPLVKDYFGAIQLCAYNSGSTIYNPVSRGNNTFQSIADYPFDLWRAKRGKSNAVAEVTIAYSVPNIRDYTLRCERMRGDQIVKTLWQR